MTPHSLSGARAGLAYGVVYSPDFGHSTEAVMVVNCGWGGVVVRPGRLDGDEDQTSVLARGEEGRRRGGGTWAWEMLGCGATSARREHVLTWGRWCGR